MFSCSWSFDATLKLTFPSSIRHQCLQHTATVRLSLSLPVLTSYHRVLPPHHQSPKLVSVLWNELFHFRKVMPGLSHTHTNSYWASIQLYTRSSDVFACKTSLRSPWRISYLYLFTVYHNPVYSQYHVFSTIWEKIDCITELNDLFYEIIAEWEF